ncbi:MAG: hypothetical protein ACI9LY_003508 [Arenicella sp.]|jgi:hypothetical protein
MISAIYQDLTVMLASIGQTRPWTEYFESLDSSITNNNWFIAVMDVCANAVTFVNICD